MKEGSRGEKLMNKKRWLIITVIVVVAVLVAVLLDMTLANHRPAITSLEAPERVIPSGICQIACTASDSDSDELSYNWSASGGNISGTGASVNWTAPDSEGFYDVTVMVTDGRSTEVMKQITIIVRANEQPIITSLVADAEWTLLGGTLQLMCTASDPDGDELSYEWSTTGGDISSMGAIVNWTAPEEVGIYDVIVVVTDGHGSSATDSVSISVATGQPPVIEQLVITKDRYGHCYLKKSGDKYLVGREQPYDVECIVSETSGTVSYNWSCDDGEITEISEDGSMIAWIAPNKYVETMRVTVIVSDIAHSMATKNIILSVVSCSACTFGSCSG
jgi:hypothetical protein